MTHVLELMPLPNAQAREARRRAKVSEFMKRRWQNDRTYCAKALATLRSNAEKQKTDPLHAQRGREIVARNMEALRAANKTPEVRRKRGEIQRKRWADPQWRARVILAVAEGKRKAKQRREAA